MTPEKRLARLRSIARSIIGLREHLLYVAAYRAHGLDKAASYHLAQMDRKAQQLPIVYRRDGNLHRYIGQPAQRYIDRVGIIALSNELGVTDDAGAARQAFLTRMGREARADNATRPWDATDDAGHEHLEREE